MLNNSELPVVAGIFISKEDTVVESSPYFSSEDVLKQYLAALVKRDERFLGCIVSTFGRTLYVPKSDRPLLDDPEKGISDVTPYVRQ